MLYRLTVLFVIGGMTLVQTQQYTASEDKYSVNLQDVCEIKTCVRKCCPNGLGLIGKGKICGDINASEPFNPPVYKDNKLDPKFKAQESFHFVNEVMNCTSPEKRMKAYGPVPIYYLTTNGSLYMVMAGMEAQYFDSSKFCIDHEQITDRNGNNITVLNTIFCYYQPPTEKFHLYKYYMLVSCFFILLTIAVYVLQPEPLKLKGKLLIAYLLCFFVGFLSLATVNFMKRPSMNTCITFTFIIYFFVLAAFFWLNVMSYNMWCVFRGDGLSNHDSSNKLFYKYCVYAFGAPTALTALLAILQYVPLPFDLPLLPKLQEQKCFFDGAVKFYYFYIPILILCIMNIVLFLMTSINLYKHERNFNKSMNSTNNRCSQERRRFWMYIHLFSLMGVSWILEVISFSYPKAHNIWQFTDAYNLLMGVLMFFIVVPIRKTYNLVCNRLKFRLPSRMSSRTLTSSLQTQSTQSMTDRKPDSLQLNSIKTQDAEEPFLKNQELNTKNSDNYI